MKNYLQKSIKYNLDSIFAGGGGCLKLNITKNGSRN